jgi:DNA-binding transcriptional regulator YhcF (GntR family)
MNNLIELDRNKKQPVYLQIIESIKGKIKNGSLHSGDRLPSINQLSTEFGLAKETVVKAFRLLQQKGIIKAVHGKGYFVSTTDIQTEHRVFVLFDTLSAYKEVLYNAIKQELGKNAFIDIYFHHFNPKVFNKLVTEAAGNYTSYIILPFDSSNIFQSLKLLPHDEVFILDRKPRLMKENYSSVYQDFHKDVYSLLDSLGDQIKKYKKIVLVLRNTITEVPVELREGFGEFCKSQNVDFEITEKPLVGFPVKKGNGYLVIDDEDLVYLVEQANLNNLMIGKDLGIISYNETSLKKVVAGGISVISTDFYNMGKQVAKMIKAGVGESIKNPSRFIDRNSF